MCRINLHSCVKKINLPVVKMQQPPIQAHFTWPQLWECFPVSMLILQPVKLATYSNRE